MVTLYMIESQRFELVEELTWVGSLIHPHEIIVWDSHTTHTLVSEIELLENKVNLEFLFVYP